MEGGLERVGRCYRVTEGDRISGGRGGGGMRGGGRGRRRVNWN